MKVQNMTSNAGNKVANQFIITGTDTTCVNGEQSEPYQVDIFQSYDTVIAKRSHYLMRPTIELDTESWDYSVTTGKYRNQFLGEGIAETRKKIKSGEYTLVNLN